MVTAITGSNQNYTTVQKTTAQSAPTQASQTVAEYESFADEQLSFLRNRMALHNGMVSELGNAELLAEQQARMPPDAFAAYKQSLEGHLQRSRASLEADADLFEGTGIHTDGTIISFDSKGHVGWDDFTLTATEVDGSFRRTQKAETYVDPRTAYVPTAEEKAMTAAQTTVRMLDGYLATLAKSVHDYNSITDRLKKPIDDDKMRQSLEHQQAQLERSMADMPLGTNGLSTELVTEGFSLSGNFLRKKNDGTYQFSGFTLSAAGRADDGTAFTASVDVSGTATVTLPGGKGELFTPKNGSRDHPMIEWYRYLSEKSRLSIIA